MAWLVGLAAMVFTLLTVPLVASAASCTRGSDCYCDCVKGQGSASACAAKFGVGVPVDSALLVCQDFEAPTLHDNVKAGGGAPDYGPPYDTNAGSVNRGDNSFWARTQTESGAGSGQCLYPYGEPSSPTLGPKCAYGSPGSQCIGVKVWHPQNLWQANGLQPCITVLRNGEFNAEVGSITSPTGVAGGGAGVFDGQQSWGHRVGAGIGSSNGIQGTVSFHGARRTFGATMAMAFPSNLVSSGITQDPVTGGQMWKFNEWHPVAAGAGGDGIFGFGNPTIGSSFPFYGFMFTESAGPGFTSACNASIQAATKTVGSFTCNDVQFEMRPGGVYNQATDWPAGTWGCMRGTYVNMGAANASVKITFTPSAGPRAGTEITVIDISNWNMGFTPGLQSRGGGYDYFIWNGYYNGNYNNGQNTGTKQTTFRYEDNVHIRAGAPVSCAQIGFGTTGGPGPIPPPAGAPAAPSGLQVR
jgi:hypothetical protein